MSESITFYAFRKSEVNNAPAAVQKFVEDFCEEGEIFGVPCFVTIGTDYKSPWIDMKDEDYEEGLSDDELKSCGIFTWFQNHPETVFEYR